jgi:hypothetical protein
MSFSSILENKLGFQDLALMELDLVYVRKDYMKKKCYCTFEAA